MEYLDSLEPQKLPKKKIGRVYTHFNLFSTRNVVMKSVHHPGS